MWGEEEDSEITRSTPEDAATIPEIKYEYLDHPADVQIRAWGSELREAFEQAAMGMFGYMTDIETVDIEEVREVEAEAEDREGLLFHFLDECLFVFSCEPYFIARKVEITEWKAGGEEMEEEKEEKKKEEEVEKGKEGEGKGGDKQKDGKGGEVGKESKEKEGKEEEVPEKRKEEEEKKEKPAERGKGEKGKPMEEEKKDEEEGKGIKNKEKGEGETEEPMEEEEEGGGNTDHGGTGGEGTSGTEGHGGGGGGVYRIRAKLFGEEFQLGKHPQGTEVKAITYASMQVYSKPGQHEVFVIIDI